MVEPADAAASVLEPGRPTAHSSDHKLHIGRGFWVTGLLVTAALVLLKCQLEHLELGRQIEQSFLNMLQLELAEQTDWDRLPVRVVDISGLTPEPVRRGDATQLLTPRKELGAIVQQIAAAAPVAIGIDIDFSPNHAGPASSDDFAFLGKLEALRDSKGEQIAAWVGISSAAIYRAEHRLVERQFSRMAACIQVPHPSGRAPVTQMIAELRLRGASQACPSMATLLAGELRAWRERTPSPDRTRAVKRRPGIWLADNVPFLLKRTRSIERGPVTAEAFAIDFGPLEQLMTRSIPVATAADLAGLDSELRGRLVLVGRGSGTTFDQFVVPAQSHPVAGVYLHALAAYTWIDAPLFELTFLGRVVMDVITAILYLTLVLVLRKGLHVLRGKDWTSLEGIVVVPAVVAVIFLFAYWSVDHLGMLWTDGVVVAAAAVLHWAVEMAMHIRRERVERLRTDQLGKAEAR